MFSIASFLAAVTVVLALLGYGYDHGYHDALRIRQDDVQRASWDYVARSRYVVIRVFSETPAQAVQELLHKVAQGWRVPLMYIPLAVFTLIALGVLLMRLKARMAKLAPSARTLLVALGKSKPRVWAAALGGCFAGGAALSIMMVAATLGLYFVTLMIGVCLSIIPLMGHQVGKVDGIDMLKKVDACKATTVQPSDPCVEVIGPSGAVVRGLLVDMDVSLIYVISTTGQLERLPKSQYRIEEVRKN